MNRKEKLDSIQYKRAGRDMLFFQIIFFLVAVVYFIMSDKSAIYSDNLVNVAMDCIEMPVFILIMMSCLRSKFVDDTVYLFMRIIFVGTVYVFFDSVSFLLESKASLATVILIGKTGFYICTVIMSTQFWRFLRLWCGDKSRHTRWLSVGVNIIALCGIAVILGNVFFNYYFSVTESGLFIRGRLFYVSLICPTVILLLCIAYVLSRKMSGVDKLIFISYPLFPWIGSVIDSVFKAPDFTCAFTFISIVFIYCNIFVRKDEALALRQAELAKSDMNSMLLQINPHFIYNTLGSISSLCHENPDEAEKMLYSFSNYLRNNFSEMALKTMIPIEKELEHLKLYISIEKLRFPDIEVVYDFAADSFMIPSLSIQPLVENAIKHGIMGREMGGKVTISTYEEKNNWCVSVVDDGVGFEKLEKDDGKNHIGVKNVQKRLEMLCGGTLIINSTLNVGTIAVIKIPKR